MFGTIPFKLILISAPWCGPCKQAESLAAKTNTLIVRSEVITSPNVRGLPSLMDSEGNILAEGLSDVLKVMRGAK